MNVPRSTYRLQLNFAFTFKDANAIIPYLAELGISHIYASPIFKAKKGSLHGYDVTDPSILNNELGERSDFDALTGKVAEYRMGWIQDIVPNHMAIDSGNDLLMDLFENGPSVQSIQPFDIEWNYQYDSVRGRLLTPILGDVYGDCLERGEIKLTYDKNGFSIRYFEHRFPLRIETYASVLSSGLEQLKNELGAADSGLIKLLGVLYSLKNLPAAHEIDARKAQVLFTKAILWELYTNDNAIRSFVNATLKDFNGTPGKPESYSQLDSLHGEQLFKLSFWKVATEELNYRRFFTVNDLISIRVENEDVFRKTHELVFDLVNQGRITGIRVDHIDGLYDPHTYLERLRRGAPDSYIIVEKILGYGESLPNVWPVQGTTGYDFLNFLNSVFCNVSNQRSIDQTYRRFSGRKVSFESLLIEKKRIIIDKHMAGDIDNLALLIKGVSGRDRRGTDITLYGLRRALIELMSFFPVYRSYINGNVFSNEDRIHLQKAIADARKTDPGLSREFAFIERFLLLQFEPYSSNEKKQEWTNVVMRFQQFTGPLMAKGLEDTVHYNYNRLISLNEVGGFPYIFGIGTEMFHHFNSKRSHNWPSTLNATSTHDTKRGEDSRARINVLSEIPIQWDQKLRIWSRINRRCKIQNDIPDPNDEYLLYQTLIGSFDFNEDPVIYKERVNQYMLKAVREANVHTTWITRNPQYEEGINQFAGKVLDTEYSPEFFSDFIPFQKKVAQFGLYNSLSQCLLKVTSPGVPDIYQGTELWDLNLVDPDNRRPVDYSTRTAFINTIKQVPTSDYPLYINSLLSKWPDGRIKMFLLYRCLKSRNDKPELFGNGAYIPLHSKGTFDECVIAFARKHEEQWAVVVVPRFLVSVVPDGSVPLLMNVWKDTAIELPSNCPYVWYDTISGVEISCTNDLFVGDLFKVFPGALLVSK